MNDLITIIKKHGALGVLTAWLWYTHVEVQDLKIRLYDCLKKENGIQQNRYRHTTPQKAAAILPTEKKRKFA
jgi:hypothetical protein